MKTMKQLAAEAAKMLPGQEVITKAGQHLTLTARSKTSLITWHASTNDGKQVTVTPNDLRN